MKVPLRMSRGLILTTLAALTLCFLAASYAMWFNTNSFALVAAADPPTPSAAATAEEDAAAAARLTIAEPGINAVTAAELRAAGLPFVDLSSEALNLTYNGRQVPFLVAELRGEPALFFYAQAAAGDHAPPPVYIVAPGAGLAMTRRDAGAAADPAPAAQQRRVWREKAYFVEDAAREDAWLGPLLLAPATWTLELDEITPDGGPATLLLQLFSTIEGAGAPDHRLSVYVNDQQVSDHTWDGRGPETLAVELPAGLLRADGDNNLKLRLHENEELMGESVYIDGLELLYQGPVNAGSTAVQFRGTGTALRVFGAGDDLLIFDVSDAAAPTLVRALPGEDDSAAFNSGDPGRQFVALPAAQAHKPAVAAAPRWQDPLRDGRWAADYIAIVADVRGFPEALQPLLAQRRAEGLRVAAVPLEQIFDEFAHGHRDPAAIRDFLAYAAANWHPPAPRYVLLAGDATYDLADGTGSRNRNRLPTPMVYQDGGYVASDAWFAGDGATGLAIGRFPAQNAPQLSAMVEKTLAYEAADGAAAWLDDALLVQDLDLAYAAAAEYMAADLEAGGYDVYRLQTGPDSAMRHSIISALNKGVGLISYVGQGSESAWGNTAALQNSDVQFLANGARLPVLATFTCRSGSFASPSADGLAESLLRAPNGGIIAAVAPAGDISAAQSLPLANAFQEEYLQAAHTRLGDVLLGLHNAAPDAESWGAALAGVNLLGDPALRLRRPGGDAASSS